MTDLYNKQMEIEMVARELGHSKALDELELAAKHDESTTNYGSKILLQVFKSIQESCGHFLENTNKKNIFIAKYYQPASEFYETIDDTYSDARKIISHPYNLIPFIVAKEVTKHIHTDTKLTTTAKNLLDTLVVSYNITHPIKNNEIASTVAVVRSFVENCPQLEIFYNYKNTACIRFVDSVIEQVDKSNETIKPHITFKPMIVKPVDHTSLTDNDGGYLSLNSPLMKRPDQSIYNSTFDVSTLNELQSTAYRINQPLLDLIENVGLIDVDVENDDLSLIKAKHTQARALRWEAKQGTDDLIVAMKLQEADRLELEATNETSEMSKHSSLLRTIELINEYKDYDELFFPVFVDNRCRVYNYCTDLNVQGNKLGKYVLELSEGQELTYEGYETLLIALGGVLGYDKWTHDKRKQEAIDVLPLIDLLFNDDDTSIISILSEAGDELYYGLGLILEINNYRTIPNYVSHFICYIDACASGTQITSLLTKSSSGARLSNLYNPTQPNSKLIDAYTIVANEVKTQYQEIATQSDNDLETLLHDQLDKQYRELV